MENAKDIYRRLAYPVLSKLCALPEKTSVYTIGARGGLPSSRLAYLERRGGVHTVGFEPDSQAATALSAKGSPIHVVFPHALGARSERRVLYITRMAGASSLYEPDMEVIKRVCWNPEWYEVVATEQVDVKRLDEVVEESNIRPPDLIHIDAQASEADILDGAEATLYNTSVVTLEAQTYPIYRGATLMGDLILRMSERGFLCCHIEDPNGNPVFKPYFVEANMSFVNARLLQSGNQRTRLLMELARLGERSHEQWKGVAYRLLARCGSRQG